MVKSKFTLLLLTGLVVGCVQAQPPVEETLKKVIEPRLGNGIKVDSIKKTPYAELYEVRAGGEILYTDKKGEYIIVGNVFNSKTSQNLTRSASTRSTRSSFPTCRSRVRSSLSRAMASV